ncbi:hypothetical protein [uncultured Roseobacter sp.]|uniref:hypothetical protein n=1 Tax=uncultured Roseobacter sp. TaxID=114847 RepID=UPI002638B6BF|nr:hypothetical protein [uncultured Roseobacter sp.]
MKTPRTRPMQITIELDDEGNPVSAEVGDPRTQSIISTAGTPSLTTPKSRRKKRSSIIRVGGGGTEPSEGVPDSVSGGGDGSTLSIIVVNPEPDDDDGVPDGASGGGWGAPLDILPGAPDRAAVPLPARMPPVADGRYAGGNSRLVLELRVDFGGSGVISGDLMGTRFGGEDYLASFRTTPGITPEPGRAVGWPADFCSRDKRTARGVVWLRPSLAQDTVVIALRIDDVLAGLPAHMVFEMTAEWQSQYLRRIGIEMEKEDGTQPPPSWNFGHRRVTWRTALQDAGFDVVDTGIRNRIPEQKEGWGQSELHTLMTDLADAGLTGPAWRQQLLWLGRPKRERLLGVMFDTSAQLPRQGSAVFEREIREWVTDAPDRKVIQTAVHEIGHGLNLSHRFGPDVGHADSTSFMNYPWQYQGGGREDGYWDRFAFAFDADELEFLRHAPRNQIIPGGDPFHSADYWSRASRGYTPYASDAPVGGLRLELLPPDPDSGMGAFRFGQQVFLEIRVTNTGTEPVPLQKRLLDPKGGFLGVRIEKSGRGATADSRALHFHPIVSRCFDLSNLADSREDETTQVRVLAPGASHSENINLTFGADGFSFAEPGHYTVQVSGTFFINTGDADPFNDKEAVTASNVLPVFIARPHSPDEEIEVETILMREDVGTFFALGGSAVLEKARDDLEAVLDRRMGRAKIPSDPVAANIMRCFGIDEQRKYRRFDGKKLRYLRSNLSKAAEHLRRVQRAGAGVFDRETRAGTGRLLEKLEKELKK